MKRIRQVNLVWRRARTKSICIVASKSCITVVDTFARIDFNALGVFWGVSCASKRRLPIWTNGLNSFVSVEAAVLVFLHHRNRPCVSPSLHAVLDSTYGIRRRACRVVCRTFVHIWKRCRRRAFAFQNDGTKSQQEKLFWLAFFCCYHYTCESCEAARIFSLRPLPLRALRMTMRSL